MPPPEPRSSTRSPSCRSATAIGLPQPRLARTASSGSPSVSPSRYRLSLKPPTASAADPVPQHESVAELPQHEPVPASSTDWAVTPGLGSSTARAAAAYRDRTCSRRSVFVWSLIPRSPLRIDGCRCHPALEIDSCQCLLHTDQVNASIASIQNPALPVIDQACCTPL